MLVSILFLLIATIYSAVGFGGGSSYIAILAFFDHPYESIPILALICNLIVVTGGSILFYKRGHFVWKLFWPYALASVPMAFIGGRIPISRETFLLLLGVCLLLVSLRLLVLDQIKSNYSQAKQPNTKIALLLGAILGLMSGLVGVGGGIFLSPILLTLRWGLPKQIAATAALFIFINSLAGLFGQLLKHAMQFDIVSHWSLFLAVLLGGQIGSRMGSGAFFSQRLIKDLTALLVLFVSVKILLT